MRRAAGTILDPIILDIDLDLRMPIYSTTKNDI